MTSTPLLRCRGIEAGYGPVQVLFGADLDVHAGEIVALLGTNGAGKSTLLRAVTGLLPPLAGTVHLDGRDTTGMAAHRMADLGVAQVAGGKAVFPSLSVDEHLRMAAWTSDDPGATQAATAEARRLFPLLERRRDARAGDLSGGEQQMLAMAMAMVARPRLLLIDELSLGLAPAVVGELLDVVRRIRDEGVGVVVVEQSLNVALTLAERAYFLEKGEVRFEGPTAELVERDDIVRSVFLSGAVGGLDTGEAGADVARVDASPRAEAGSDGEPVLEVRGVSRSFGGIRAVDDASLHVDDGEIVGIIGANGAGKTTLFDLVCGYVDPDEGEVVLCGEDLTALAPHDRARRGLGRSFQDARLVPSLSVAENLALGFEGHLLWHDHLAAALRLPGQVRQEEDVAWSVDDLVELMGLQAYRDKLANELSTGTRRVVDLAMVIAQDPTIVLLDEPASGVAQRETESLGPLLRRIQAETGCSMLVIEHDIPFLTGVADRLVAMDLGHPIAEGSPGDVLEDPRVLAAYLGGDPATIHRSGTAVGA